ncbi:rho guanine nucleotide exchange factor 40 isoform X1 [Paramormyrops kingsleyae]|uniref:rho guanine nucleotide exchange factor 40 isoform X1 n=1 Tax=Paramormyrops kingsleyae TaxID=1676925 RepID=UPI003B96AEB8
MGSEAVEDCVQGALSSLYPPFESTAPPLLSQVFSVLESTYQHDSLRYLLDYFIPAKHLLHKLQQHACAQYLGCLFLHSGWPLSLGEKVVVQLSTLDWRLLRSNDFYLQVVPFSTRCPRLALKCLAPGGRNVQEVLVPESQHALVFTPEWLQSINKERGCVRGAGKLDTCLVSTCDGVIRLPWEDVVYPKFLYHESGKSDDSTSHDWGSSCDLESLSWDEEEEEEQLPPDGDAVDPGGEYVELLEMRGGPDGGADPKRYLEMQGAGKTKTLPLCRRSRAVRLRRGKGWDHGKHDTMGATRPSGNTTHKENPKSTSRGREVVAAGDDMTSRPAPQVIDLPRDRNPDPSLLQSLNEIDRPGRDVLGPSGAELPLVGFTQERKPGVGREKEGSGSSEALCGYQRRNETETSENLRDKTGPDVDPVGEHNNDQDKLSNSSCAIEDVQVLTDDAHSRARDAEGTSGECRGSLMQSGTEQHNTDPTNQDSSAAQMDRAAQHEEPANPEKPLLNPSTPTAPNNTLFPQPGSETSLTTGLPSQHDLQTELNTTSSHQPGFEALVKTNSSSQPAPQTGPQPAPALKVKGQAKILRDKDALLEKDVKVAEFRAHRKKRKGKGGRAKIKPTGCLSHEGPDQPPEKLPNKTSPEDTRSKPTPTADDQQEHVPAEMEEVLVPANQGTEEMEIKKNGEDDPSIESKTCSDENSNASTLLSDHSSNKATDHSGDSSCAAPHLLKDLDTELLQSETLALTGTADRLGRPLIIMQVPNDGHSEEELSRILSCYHAITRLWAQEKGLTVVVDSRVSTPNALCLAALQRFQDLVPGGLGCKLVLTDENQESSLPHIEGVEVHIVRGLGILQQHVDRQQLPVALGGDFPHSHSEWLAYRLSLERLTEWCRSALSLLGQALHSLDTEPLPQCTKMVSVCVEKHKKLMMDVLADQRLTELQQVGGAWLAGLTNRGSGPAQRSTDCRAALAATTELYNSVDDSLHRLVRVSNERGRDLDALRKLVALEERLNKCEKELEQVQEQLEEFKDTPLSLSMLSLKQQKFKAFRESAMELQRETHSVLGELESWAELEWAGLGMVLERLPPVRERLRDMSHCLSDCWTQLDSTQRLLSTLTEASQWCDAVSASPGPPTASPLASLPPIPPSRFQDARALALELGGGPLLELWSRTLERYQRTLAQFKTRLLQAPPPAPPPPRPKAASSSSMWDLLNADGEMEGEGDGDWGGLQSWGSLASLFRPQNCSTLKIGEERKKDGAAGGGGKFLQALLHPAKKSPPEAPLPPKPPRKRHPSFDLQALLAPRRTPTNSRPAEIPGAASRNSPMSWLGRKTLVDPILNTSMAAALPVGGAAVGVGSVLIRGVEVSSKEVVDHTGSPRQHVLLFRTERETGGERQGATTQSKIYHLWCGLLSSERQYVAVLKGVEESYQPLLDCPETPAPLRGKWETLFSNWSSLSSFHAQHLLPNMEGALTQTLLLQDSFCKFKEEFLQYSHYIRTRPDPDSMLVSQASDFFKAKLPALSPLSPLAFPQCLTAPTQRLAQYCEVLEDLGSLNSASEAALSTLRLIQRHGEDLRASDFIVGCPVPLADRGELVRQGELLVCGAARRRKAGLRTIFLYQHYLILTKTKNLSLGRTVHSFKHSLKVGEMGLTQSLGEEGVKFEVWVRQASRTCDCLTLQAPSPDERVAWTHDIAQLLWTHAIHNTELCLKESLCMGVSSKLLLDVTGAHSASELDSGYSLNDRVQSSCSDSSSVGSHKEGGSPASGRDSQINVGQTGQEQPLFHNIYCGMNQTGNGWKRGAKGDWWEATLEALKTTELPPVVAILVVRITVAQVPTEIGALSLHWHLIVTGPIRRENSVATGLRVH